jgi:co-chaperonin GroES (HSP10)
MKAIGIYLIVDKLKVETTKIAGLELTESQNKDVRYLRGKVISSGSQVEGINEGDVVWYDKHAGHGIDIDNKLYQVIKIHDIVIVE